jgi:hypothetical protein
MRAPVLPASRTKSGRASGHDRVYSDPRGLFTSLAPPGGWFGGFFWGGVGEVFRSCWGGRELGLLGGLKALFGRGWEGLGGCTRRSWSWDGGLRGCGLGGRSPTPSKQKGRTARQGATTHPGTAAPAPQTSAACRRSWGCRGGGGGVVQVSRPGCQGFGNGWALICWRGRSQKQTSGADLPAFRWRPQRLPPTSRCGPQGQGRPPQSPPKALPSEEPPQ